MHFLLKKARKRFGKWRTLQNVVVDARGWHMIFVDTCHAENAFNAGLVKDPDN